MSDAIPIFATMFVPIVIIAILVFVNILRTVVANQQNGEKKPMNPADLFHRQERNFRSSATSRGEDRYSRQVSEVHKGDPRGDYERRLDQLKNLYESGMMEREEYDDRRHAVEDDYRNGRQL